MEVFDERDKILASYFLNELSKEENEEIEDEMVLDPDFSERAQAVETNMVESYVLGEMSAAENARFAQGYLIFPDNREKVEDARAFHEALRMRRRERRKVTNTPPVQTKHGWLAALLRMPAPAMAFATLVLIASVVVFFLLIDRLRSNQVASDNQNGQEKKRQQIVSQPEGSRDDNSTRDTSKVIADAPTNNNTNGNLPTNREIVKLNTSPKGRVVVSLDEKKGRVNASPMGTGDKVEVKTLKIPASAKSFTLRVNLTRPEYREYFEEHRDCFVDISDIKGTRLYPTARYRRVRAKPVAGMFQVSLNVPTAYLKNGETYYFRVSELNSHTPFQVKFTK